jgi:DNA-directed RNA polymerase subunit E'
MYSIYSIRDTLSIPPKALGGKLDETVLSIAQNDYEGLVDEDVGVVVAVTAAERVGEGKIIPGDGSIYFDVKMDMLVYKPVLQEVVEGMVSEVTEFGAFIRTGPIEGLIHVSQIMDDYINYDAKLPGFVGKESKKKLKLEDTVLARTVTASLKGSISSSKIGFTMRQLGLGKKEWLKVDEKKAKAAEKKKPAKKAEKKEAKK